MCQVGIYVQCRRGTRQNEMYHCNLELGRCVGECVCVCEKDLPCEAPECSFLSLVGDVLPRSPTIEDLVLSQRRVALVRQPTGL